MPEQFRIRLQGTVYETKEGDPCGAFLLPGSHARGRDLKIVADDGKETGWQHVSVSVLNKREHAPSWLEMVIVKDLFWDDEECVIQFHPPKSEYVNCHPGTLHLWKPLFTLIPTPPSILVGPKGKS